jgi:hypothetical protein
LDVKESAYYNMQNVKASVFIILTEKTENTKTIDNLITINKNITIFHTKSKYLNKAYLSEMIDRLVYQDDDL